MLTVMFFDSLTGTKSVSHRAEPAKRKKTSRGFGITRFFRQR